MWKIVVSRCDDDIGLKFQDVTAKDRNYAYNLKINYDRVVTAQQWTKTKCWELLKRTGWNWDRWLAEETWLSKKISTECHKTLETKSEMWWFQKCVWKTDSISNQTSNTMLMFNVKYICTGYLSVNYVTNLDMYSVNCHKSLIHYQPKGFTIFMRLSVVLPVHCFQKKVTEAIRL